MNGDHHLGGPVTPPETITCVDCGGTCHLLTRPFEDEDGSVGFRAGDVVAYRCSDCLDRWDVELDGDADDGRDHNAGAP